MSINQFEASVMHGLHTQFQPEVGFTGKFLEIIKDIILQAIRAGGDDKTHDI